MNTAYFSSSVILFQVDISEFSTPPLPLILNCRGTSKQSGIYVILFWPFWTPFSNIICSSLTITYFASLSVGNSKMKWTILLCSSPFLNMSLIPSTQEQHTQTYFHIDFSVRKYFVFLCSRTVLWIINNFSHFIVLNHS